MEMVRVKGRGHPSRWRPWIRQRGRRVRRRLGLPAFGGRAWLLAILVFLGLTYFSVTILTDFFAQLGRYSPLYYEPKDFQRGPQMREEKR